MAETMKRNDIPWENPKVRHWVHYLCGAAGAYCMPINPHYGWSIILGFHGYEAWQDYYFHDGGFKDIWEFWVVFIPLAVLICILKQTGVI